MLMWSGLIKIHSGSHFDQEISNQFEVKTESEIVEKDKKSGLKITHSIGNLNSGLFSDGNRPLCIKCGRFIKLIHPSRLAQELKW